VPRIPAPTEYVGASIARSVWFLQRPVGLHARGWCDCELAQQIPTSQRHRLARWADSSENLDIGRLV